MAKEEIMIYFYLMGDQPTTCPICGARTDILGSVYYTDMEVFINECLSNECKYIFCEVED
jgi:hypothetical protein